MMHVRAIVSALILALTAAPALAAEARLAWTGWRADVVAQAKEQGRFIILDLEAVWCHWCHVMEAETYQDQKVVGLLKSKFLTVRADQDANPDLSNRYGDWGWPATIIFAPDGTELIKRRGYIPPAEMAALLQAVIDDPTPGPSVDEPLDIKPSASPALTAPQREDLSNRSRDAYDDALGGWGDGQKFIDADAMDWLLSQAEKGDPQSAQRAQQTLDAALVLIDPVWGGIYQYSATPDWRSPHYEKIMWYQANGLRHYAHAYALWKNPKHLAAARALYGYLTTKLLSPDGGFTTSQDADVDTDMPGKDFYALDAKAREALGRQPRIDTAIYARENGWAISAMVAYYDATGERSALDAAEQSAAFIVAHRRGADGVFRHGAHDRAGPFLGDTLAMGQAALDLYAATGKRSWLALATQSGQVLNRQFKDEVGGFRTTLEVEGNSGIFLKPVKPIDEQTQMARFANRLDRYVGAPEFKQMAEHAARYLASGAILEQPRPFPGILLVDQELRTEPTHITIVGHKSDPAAIELHRAARAIPSSYERLDWWDTGEGPLPNPDVQYPELDHAAAFICTNHICSLPIEMPSEIAQTLQRISAPLPLSKS